eukprot:CAMPEP_0198708718 /NCGR_PEP_ID=MMETSP1471-20131121/1280_1 /TAXON_ID=41880 /ORGANISM="Pycnococcus provasolii, Strain RCC733" /LENGTH=149 /DNA_ID=CAMNT_0044467999 /DNA_START=59 /DNA_END=508 /DNA_ORIENTATION=+
MATSRSSISNARAPTHRVTARPASSSLKTHRRSLLCRAEDTQTSAANVVTDATFEELVLKSPVPVLVDFWAPWCGPCRMIAPLIDEISNEYGDKLRALKLNTDESPSVATEYGIRSIPTVMIFKDGAKLDTVIGAVPKSTLVNAIEKYL